MRVCQLLLVIATTMLVSTSAVDTEQSKVSKFDSNDATRIQVDAKRSLRVHKDEERALPNLSMLDDVAHGAKSPPTTYKTLEHIPDLNTKDDLAKYLNGLYDEKVPLLPFVNRLKKEGVFSPDEMWNLGRAYQDVKSAKTVKYLMDDIRKHPTLEKFQESLRAAEMSDENIKELTGAYTLLKTMDAEKAAAKEKVKYLMDDIRKHPTLEKFQESLRAAKMPDENIKELTGAYTLLKTMDAEKAAAKAARLEAERLARLEKITHADDFVDRMNARWTGTG